MTRKSMVTACLSLLYLVFYLIVIALIKLTIGTNFWIGYTFAVLSIIALNLLVAFSDKREDVSFPQSISMVTFAVLYALAVFIINIKYAQAIIINNKIVDIVSTNAFVLYQLIALVVFIIIELIINANKNHLSEANIKIENEEKARKEMINELSILIEESKKLQDSKELIKELENTIEKIKYGNVKNEELEINNQIFKKIEKFRKELKNLVDIDGFDYTALKDIIIDINELLIEKDNK